MHLPRTPEEIVDFFRAMSGHRPVPEWIFQMLDVLFERKDEATYENIRLRE